MEKNIIELRKKFLERDYNETSLNSQLAKAMNKDRESILQYKEPEFSGTRTPFITTYNKHLPNIKSVFEKTWKILQIHPKLATQFEAKPVIAYKRNQKLRDVIGQTQLSGDLVVRKGQDSEKRCKPCRTRPDNLCCKQVCQTTTFNSTRTNQVFKMYHNTDCKSMFVIYLLECTICKLQYVGKSEPPFNIRLNNHRKDSSSVKEETIVASRHFQNPGHKFNRDAKFTIIEKIKNSYMAIEDKRDLLRRRETFWINKLRAMTPGGLNQE